MQSFLQLVAHDLYTKIGNDLSRTVLVFPNKRANLFFNEYLAGESDKPIWSPAAMSISDLFQKLSVQKSGDPIRLVCELYKVFKEETRSQETLDDFYFWGELLISDFDDVDKNMVDADKLFSNLQDLKNLMDDYEFLDKEQEEAIQQFFQNFSIEKRTELKEKFISLWDKLGTIYHRYRANLTELGIAYEGMLYRNVIEQLDTDQLKYDKYIFVGFNVLNKVESDFFRKLKDAGKALFYWDYEKENAVVLCNEALLLPVLHSIPQEVKNVNITMGFPLAQTPVYSFINAVMELQTNGYRSDTDRFTYEAVSAILKHPYTQQLSSHAGPLERELTQTNRFYPLPSELKQDDFLTTLFTPRNGIKELCDYLIELIKNISTIYRKEGEYNDIFNQLYRESLFQSHTKINRLYSLIESGELNIRTDTLKRLITKVLTSSNIPFHGEPAIGMQVMGVLETRNLDFRNLIILSLNEGQLPKCSVCLLLLSTDTTGREYHATLQYFFGRSQPWRRIPLHAAITCRRST